MAVAFQRVGRVSDASNLCPYGGAVASSQLDARPDAVRLARELASVVLSTSPKRSAGAKE